VTAYAEVVAIRGACAKFGTFHLSGCEIYARCEPCPMCLGAIYWARFRTLYYANTRAEAAAIGFDDELICCERLLAAAAHAIPGVHLRTPQFAVRGMGHKSRQDQVLAAARGKRVQLRRNRSCMPSACWRTIEHAMTPAWPMIERFLPEHSRVGDASRIGRVEPREVGARMVPRPASFPSHVPHNVNCHTSTDRVRLLETAPEGAFVAIMTRSHALDLDVTAAALLAGRFACVGLIGSATKRARLAGTVRQIGIGDADLTHLICPAGLIEIRDKAPAAIAAAIAQLLIRRDTAAAATSPKPGAIVPSGARHA